MTQTQWKPEVQAMWAKLESLQFDNRSSNDSISSGNESAAACAFTRRLAKENRWAPDFTGRVIDEYRRFLFLAAQAGHAVTPSEAVDQAWHLHLVYTRSYWQTLCGDILGRPLHHEPGSGGLDEEARFHRQYQRTLESYRRLFGSEPPPDIWPRGADAGPPAQNRWVDASRHWVLPRPVLRLPRVLRRLRESVREKLLPQHLRAAALGLPVLLLAGCDELRLKNLDLSVLDYRGPDFLEFYLVIFGLALVLSLVISHVARRPRLARPPETTLNDPYEIAFLGGGARRLVDALLAALHSRGLVEVQNPARGRSTVGAKAATAPSTDHPPLRPLEREAWQALPHTTQSEVWRVRKQLEPQARQMRRNLVARGLVLSTGRHIATTWFACLPLLLVIGLGVIKVILGIQRGRPVGFLVVLLVCSLAILLLRGYFVNRRTAAGARVWSSCRRRPVSAWVQREGRQSLSPEHAPLAVAVLGTAALAHPDTQPLHDALHRAGHNASGGCGSAGCGGGSCCGGGSGCGGGGCGGCGGGGD